MNVAQLIIADSEKNANLYYATRFLAPDSFVFFRINGKKSVIMSDLEVDRARSHAKVDEVLSFTHLAQQASKAGNGSPSMMDIVDFVFKERRIKEIEVPGDFGVVYADALRKRGYTVTPKPEPFFPERVIKSKEEIEALTEALRITEDALATAIELISQTEIKPDKTLVLAGKPLTVELLRKTMHLSMMERECVAQHTIIAPGIQAVDPHNEGSGPLRAHEPIVMDVFPQHARTRYYADITRTVVRGKASPKIQKMFDAVKHGQDIAYASIKEGADGGAIHKAIDDYFVSQGFKTGEQNGRMQGFFHGTGHGVGVEIHEAPRISAKGDILKAGMVVTVEPGLYYEDAGGIRIEDMVVVTKTGCDLMTKAPKILEV